MATTALTITRNDVSPKLAGLASTAKNPSAVFRAMGTVFKSITEGNFNSVGEAYRPAKWADKKDGTPSNLKKSGLLWHSFHLTITDRAATLSNPTPYAAAHQFGYAKRNLPARPFFPVKDGKLTAAAEEKIGAAAVRAIKAQAGI